MSGDFDTLAEALDDLLRRLRVLFQAGDRIEIGVSICDNLAEAEVQLRELSARLR